MTTTTTPSFFALPRYCSRHRWVASWFLEAQHASIAGPMNKAAGTAMWAFLSTLCRSHRADKRQTEMFWSVYKDRWRSTRRNTEVAKEIVLPLRGMEIGAKARTFGICRRYYERCIYWLACLSTLGAEEQSSSKIAIYICKMGQGIAWRSILQGRAMIRSNRYMKLFLLLHLRVSLSHSLTLRKK